MVPSAGSSQETVIGAVMAEEKKGIKEESEQQGNTKNTVEDRQEQT